jgi:hypothetical protein
MAKASIRRPASAQPRPSETFLDVLPRRLRQCGPPSVARRRTPVLVLRPFSTMDGRQAAEVTRCDNLWVAAADQASTARTNDCLCAVPVVGLARRYLRQFPSSVPGGAIASLTSTPQQSDPFSFHPAFWGRFRPRRTSKHLAPSGLPPTRPRECRRQSRRQPCNCEPLRSERLYARPFPNSFGLG